MSRYIILNDGAILGDIGLSEYAYFDAQLTEAVNTAGSFTFSLLADNPELPNVQLLKSVITLRRNGVEIFRGRVISSELDIYNRRKLTCEGAMAFLNDIRNYFHTRVAAPMTQWDTPATAIGDILDYYNSQCLPTRQIQLGTVQPTTRVYFDFRYTQTLGEYVTAIDALREVANQAGGYFQMRYENSVAYLDFLSPASASSGQSIMFGTNLLDITRYINGAGLITELFAMSSYSGLATTITDSTLTSAFGRIVGWKVFDEEISTQTELDTLAKQFFDENSMAQMTITVSATDLNLTDDSITAFAVGQLIRVMSPPHGISVDMVLSEMTTDISNPAASRITLGSTFRGFTTYVTNSIREGYNTVYRRLETAFQLGVNAV